jgi:hypothetical protein
MNDVLLIKRVTAWDAGLWAMRWRRLFYFAPWGWGVAVLAVEYETPADGCGAAHPRIFVGKVEDLYGEFVEGASK